MNTIPGNDPPNADARGDEFDDALGRLLRIAGASPEPPAGMKERVRAAAHREWRAEMQARRRRRTLGWSALAASVLLAAGLALELTSGSGDAFVPEPFGLVDRSVGSASVRHADGDGGWRELEPGATALRGGDVVRTSVDGLVGIRVADDLSLRLDSATTVRLVSARRLSIERGRVYVDSRAPASPQGRVEIETPVGVAWDVGTQFEVRYDGTAMRVRVREGRVSMETADARFDTDAGGQLTIDELGRAARGRIPPYDAEWRWSEPVAPAFDIDGLSVLDYLRWVARETGRRLEFSSESARTAASHRTLMGSLGRLGPSASLGPILSTTHFRHELIGDEVIMVILQGDGV